MLKYGAKQIPQHCRNKFIRHLFAPSGRIQYWNDLQPRMEPWSNGRNILYNTLLNFVYDNFYNDLSDYASIQTNITIDKVIDTGYVSYWQRIQNYNRIVKKLLKLITVGELTVNYKCFKNMQRPDNIAPSWNLKGDISSRFFTIMDYLELYGVANEFRLKTPSIRLGPITDSNNINQLAKQLYTHFGLYVTTFLAPKRYRLVEEIVELLDIYIVENFCQTNRKLVKQIHVNAIGWSTRGLKAERPNPLPIELPNNNFFTTLMAFLDFTTVYLVRLPTLFRRHPLKKNIDIKDYGSDDLETVHLRFYYGNQNRRKRQVPRTYDDASLTSFYRNQLKNILEALLKKPAMLRDNPELFQPLVSSFGLPEPTTQPPPPNYDLDNDYPELMNSTPVDENPLKITIHHTQDGADETVIEYPKGMEAAGKKAFVLYSPITYNAFFGTANPPNPSQRPFLRTNYSYVPKLSKVEPSRNVWDFLRTSANTQRKLDISDASLQNIRTAEPTTIWDLMSSRKMRRGKREKHKKREIPKNCKNREELKNCGNCEEHEKREDLQKRKKREELNNCEEHEKRDEICKNCEKREELEKRNDVSDASLENIRTSKPPTVWVLMESRKVKRKELKKREDLQNPEKHEELRENTKRENRKKREYLQKPESNEDRAELEKNEYHEGLDTSEDLLGLSSFSDEQTSSEYYDDIDEPIAMESQTEKLTPSTTQKSITVKPKANKIGNSVGIGVLPRPKLVDFNDFIPSVANKTTTRENTTTKPKPNEPHEIVVIPTPSVIEKIPLINGIIGGLQSEAEVEEFRQIKGLFNKFQTYLKILTEGKKRTFVPSEMATSTTVSTIVDTMNFEADPDDIKITTFPTLNSYYKEKLAAGIKAQQPSPTFDSQSKLGRYAEILRIINYNKPSYQLTPVRPILDNPENAQKWEGRFLPVITVYGRRGPNKDLPEEVAERGVQYARTD